ncbi:hypothetical protein [Marinomonas sp.]
MEASDLHFMYPSDLVTPKTPIWSLPSLPPPDDWFLSIDTNGANLSKYGDDYWDYSAFGYSGFNFGMHNLSNKNLKLAKIVLITVIYHPRLFPGKIISCKQTFMLLIKIAKVCDIHGILISELSRFPRLHASVSDALQRADYISDIKLLHKLRLYSDLIGFEIADEKTLAFLSAKARKREIVQHAYIPPRIWSYSIKRLNQILDEFHEIQSSVGTAFNWLSDAYRHNSLIKSIPSNYISPVAKIDKNDISKVQKLISEGRIEYDGTAYKFLTDYNIMAQIEKWTKPTRVTMSVFSGYLSFIRDTALFFIASFSIQRQSEVISLRSDCFLTEKDDRLGDIFLLVGETTKTEQDNDARWVVPETVKKAVDIAAFISKLRSRHHKEMKHNESIPLALIGREPWALGTGNSQRAAKKHICYTSYLRSFPHVFEQEEIMVTKSDWEIALSLTPNLGNRDEFGIGKPWHFSAHQLRRTSGVNMFSSQKVSVDSLQWSMKHHSRAMTLYYGKNHTNLRLNSEVETALIVESYRSVSRQLVQLVKNSTEFVRPHSKGSSSNEIINLIEENDEKKLTQLIKKGSINCRRTLLGFCMKSGACEYGGIESISKCAGTLDTGICQDAIFDRKNESRLSKLKSMYEEEISDFDTEELRLKALQHEIKAIEVYLNVIKQ